MPSESKNDYRCLAKKLAEHSKAIRHLSEPRFWQYVLILYKEDEQKKNNPTWKGLTIREVVDKLGMKKNIQNLYRDFKRLYDNKLVSKALFLTDRADTAIYRLTDSTKQFIYDLMRNTDQYQQRFFIRSQITTFNLTIEEEKVIKESDTLVARLEERIQLKKKDLFSKVEQQTLASLRVIYPTFRIFANEVKEMLSDPALSILRTLTLGILNIQASCNVYKCIEIFRQLT
ncbi:MAG: hypothetical protein ACFFDT_18945 [Candidatus Hodarchaeota archaeon]